MAETTCWTKDDLPRALEWVMRDAKASVAFRVESVDVVEASQESRAITEPSNLAPALRPELTEQARPRLVRALRQYEPKAVTQRGAPTIVVARPALSSAVLSRRAHTIDKRVRGLRLLHRIVGNCQVLVSADEKRVRIAYN